MGPKTIATMAAVTIAAMFLVHKMAGNAQLKSLFNL